MKVKEITREEAKEIIENRMPFGCFWLQEGAQFIGIDNQSGDAWTEEFTSKGACIGWLEK